MSLPQRSRPLSPGPSAIALAPFVTACTVLALLAGLFIPAIYAVPETNITNPRLGFLYRQYNPDAPNFFYSALDFPGIYKKLPERASRPLFSLILKPASAAVAGIVSTVAPRSRAANLRWGGHLAVERLTVYFGWILVNGLLLWLLLLLLAEGMLRWLHPADVKIGLFLSALAPPVLLSLTQLHTNVVGWVIVAASVVFWLRMKEGRRTWTIALLLGVLLLAKMHVTVLLVGLLLVWRGERRLNLLVCAAIIAAPTLAWRAFCAWYGVDAGVWELRTAALSLVATTPGAFAQRVILFVIEQGIGLALLVNPIAVFWLMRGVGRVPWTVRPWAWAGIAAIVEILAMFALQRAGASYLTGLYFVILPLFFAGMLPGNAHHPGPGIPRCQGHWCRAMVAAHLLWLPAALFAQLWLWRHNWWF